MSEADAVVFVVDDDPAIRDALTSLLRSVGLTVETFGSAQDFLNRQPPDEPSCLVLDVRLPGLSGLDLQRALATAQMMPAMSLGSSTLSAMSIASTVWRTASGLVAAKDTVKNNFPACLRCSILATALALQPG